jgi:orotidine-5'-phosphate decarboxylase
MNAADNLIQKVEEKKSHLIIGLDLNVNSDPSKTGIPHFLIKNDGPEGISEAFFEYNKGIIDATHDLVPAYKPNISFYEKFGSDGIEAFKKTIDYIKEKGCIVVGDAKRNEIGNSAQAYSDAFLGKVWVKENGVFVNKPSFDVDFLTVNQYLGRETIEETFVKDSSLYGKGIFVLVKTSNPGSGDLQDKLMSTQKLTEEEIDLLKNSGANFKEGLTEMYNHVALAVRSMGKSLIGERGYSPVGAVVGGTYPKEASILRKLMPFTIILAPGYGVQGGKAEMLVNCFNDEGLGAIVNNSRGINFAYQLLKINETLLFKPEEFAEAARYATIKSINDINGTLAKNNKLRWDDWKPLKYDRAA